MIFVRKWTFPDILMQAPMHQRCLAAGGGRGMFPWGNFAIVGLKRALFLYSIGLDFEENIMLEA